MRVARSSAALAGALSPHRAAGRAVGLVPTMGALHAGHRSLIERAAAECSCVVVTIFVNPLQFGDPDDIERYPRTLAADLAVCEDAGAAVVFVPTVREMYPAWPEPPANTVRVGPLGRPWEGESRPGHFDGVATVVAKLFAMVGCCRAYFGEKDFQQLAVVRQMVADLSFPVEVVGCPIVREPGGLALSSRNGRLSPSERSAAAVLSRALGSAREAVAGGERRPGEVSALMTALVGEEAQVSLDYATVVDADDLTVPPVIQPGRALRLLIAAQVGAVRLIDNCEAAVPAEGRDRAFPAGTCGASTRTRRVEAPVVPGPGTTVPSPAVGTR
ncbi:MAG TPA: pantoate--beta-alanine ligase [Acidimicrobiales bacterium]|nr:pantoate--beta-alanine ligase [Acidimicrobiales bacterium]